MDGFVIEMFSKTDCPSCVKATEWLRNRGYDYEQIKLETQAERDALYDRLGLSGDERRVPQIFIVDTESGHRERVGGYDALETGASGL